MWAPYEGGHWVCQHLENPPWLQAWCQTCAVFKHVQRDVTISLIPPLCSVHQTKGINLLAHWDWAAIHNYYGYSLSFLHDLGRMFIYLCNKKQRMQQALQPHKSCQLQLEPYQLRLAGPSCSLVGDGRVGLPDPSGEIPGDNGMEFGENRDFSGERCCKVIKFGSTFVPILCWPLDTCLLMLKEWWSLLVATMLLAHYECLNTNGVSGETQLVLSFKCVTGLFISV